MRRVLKHWSCLYPLHTAALTSFDLPITQHCPVKSCPMRLCTDNPIARLWNSVGGGNCVDRSNVLWVDSIFREGATCTFLDVSQNVTCQLRVQHIFASLARVLVRPRSFHKLRVASCFLPKRATLSPMFSSSGVCPIFWKLVLIKFFSSQSRGGGWAHQQIASSREC